jgi:hypothetical protein
MDEELHELKRTGKDVELGNIKIQSVKVADIVFAFNNS